MNPYRNIPSVDSLLSESRFAKFNRPLLLEAIRVELERIRQSLSENPNFSFSRQELLEAISRGYERSNQGSLQTVINATGVILHTNFGRAPLEKEIIEEAVKVAAGYCNLEYNLEDGRRGERYEHLAKAFRELFGCEDALVVNNNAAAVFLILNTFANGKEAVLSRGELVEIGGSFRIPEVMRASGAILKEVGTTNKTHPSDYEEAIGEQTAILMKVHKSNYRIEGFSQDVSFAAIRSIARANGLIDYYDLGSAYLPQLLWGLSDEEPSIFKILADKPSLISFSGDKLFGSVQAGIILGKKELISRLKRNQILRMFRVDKLTIALLERTLLAYRKAEYEKIATLRILNESIEKLKLRAKRLEAMLALESEVRESKTYVGGGTMPGKTIPTVILALKGDAKELERHFRARRIIGRIEREHFVLDMRTVRDWELDQIAKAAKEIMR